MEIGSFIELGFQKGREYYKGTENIARLNTGRAGIYHASRVWNCDIVYLPIYQCETVRDFLVKKGVTVKYYAIDWEFTPKIECIESNACIVIVNYFGVMSNERMKKLSSKYEKVIIDNSQAFFAEPIKGVLSVYSARKFVGVPDGSYVIGEGVGRYVNNYEQCFSSDTSIFLLQRIEYGCEGKTYANRSLNEERINQEDVMEMSQLTRTILDGVDYEENKEKRRENFQIASSLFSSINKLDAEKYYDATCVPMVYPLVVEDEKLIHTLLEAKHFQGRWWNYILSETDEGTFEYWLSKYMIPITIDQRYGVTELKYIRGLL